MTEESNQDTYPNSLDRAWKERVLAVAANVLAIPSTRARPALSPSVECDNNEDVTGAVGDPDEGGSPSKRQRIAQDRCTTISTSVTTQQEHHQSGRISWSYWHDSPEARQVFKPASGIGSNHETAKEAVERRIKLLQTVAP